MSLNLVSLNAARSESFSRTSKQIKSLIPVCKAAKNKKLLRLLQQRAVGNKSANFLGTKIYVYHRIAKRKKFNKLAVCLMNRELYNSIRDLGCHSWVMGIQYGMIRELRRIHGRRILSSRCLENLEDIPTEILLCMIWKQLQLIPVTRKVAEEKVQQIMRCYMSLIWAVSIRKGLQTIQKIHQKKHKYGSGQETEKLSGSVNWKWRILQQSNKLLSKFLLKTNNNKCIKASASQISIQLDKITSALHLSENEIKNPQEIESTIENVNGKRRNTIDSQMKRTFDQVISEMKIKLASKRLCSESDENLECHSSKPSTEQTKMNSPDELRETAPLRNTFSIPIRRTCETQYKTEMTQHLPPIQKRNQLLSAPAGESDEDDPIWEDEDIPSTEYLPFSSYFRGRSQTNRNNNDLSHFTLPSNCIRSKSEISLSKGSGQSRTLQDPIVNETKEESNEKSSRLRRAVDNSNQKMSQGAREYCKRLLLAKFEEDLPRIRLMHTEKKETSSTKQDTEIWRVEDFANHQCDSKNLRFERFNTQKLENNAVTKFDGNLEKLNPHLEVPDGSFLKNESTAKSSYFTPYSPHLQENVETYQFLSNRRDTSDSWDRRYEKKKSLSEFTEKNEAAQSLVKPENIRFHWDDEAVLQGLTRKQDNIGEYQERHINAEDRELDDNDYEATLRGLQESISMHDTELRKLRFLNNVIDTNWQYFSSRHDKKSEIKLKPDVDKLELCQESSSRLQVDEIRSEIWRKILNSEGEPYKNTKCNNFQAPNDVRLDEIPVGKRRKEGKRITDGVKDKVQIPTDFIKKRSKCELSSRYEVKEGIKKTGQYIINNEDLRTDFKTKNVHFKEKREPEVNISGEGKTSNCTLNNKFSHKSDSSNLEHNADKRDGYDLKKQTPAGELEGLNRTKICETDQLQQTGEVHRCLGRDQFRRSSNFFRQLILHKNKKKAKFRNYLFKVPKKDWLERCIHRTHKGFRNNLGKEPPHGLHKEHNCSAQALKPLNNGRETVKEKKTEIIYNNNNFKTMSQNEFINANKYISQKGQATKLKNILGTKYIEKLPPKEGFRKVPKKVPEKDVKWQDGTTDTKLREPLQEKNLKSGLNDLESNMQKNKEPETLFIQNKVSLRARRGKEKHLDVKHPHPEHSEWFQVCHLMLNKRKLLKDNLKQVNEFLMQMLENKARKKRKEQKVRESLIRAAIKTKKEKINPGLDLDKPHVTRSETVNTTYYIKNQTVIRHSRNLREPMTHCTTSEQIDPVLFTSMNLEKGPGHTESRRMATDDPHITSQKKVDHYRLIMFVAFAFLLYHSMSLLSLLHSHARTNNFTGFRCRTF